MLELTVTLKEGYDESIGEFVELSGAVLQLEHSLVSLSKWESKWEKSFLDSKTEKTEEMLLDYIRCMILNEYEEETLQKLTREQVTQINEYINAKRTATWFNERPTDGRRAPRAKVITSDLIYYWMVAMTIPFECQTWHLNRLITLIRITEAENKPKERMGRKESMAQHRATNQRRRSGR